MSAMVYQSNETAVVLVLQTNPLGGEPFSYVKYFFVPKYLHGC